MNTYVVFSKACKPSSMRTFNDLNQAIKYGVKAAFADMHVLGLKPCPSDFRVYLTSSNGKPVQQRVTQEQIDMCLPVKARKLEANGRV